MPRADRTRFSDWGLVFEALLGSDAFDQAERLIVDYEEYFTALLSEKRRVPGDDLLSALRQSEEQGDRLSADEALATAFSLFGAGFDTTRHQIGNAVNALLSHLAAEPKQAALAEAYRVLRPGGRLHVADWGRPSDPLSERPACAGLS